MYSPQFPASTSRNRLRFGAAALMIAAGVIHLLITPQHWSHAPVHGLVMALIGVLEIGWGLAYWRTPSVTMTRFGLLMGIGLITLWAITRVAPAPFGHGPEHIDALGSLSKLCEGLGVAALMPLAVFASGAGARWRALGAMTVVAVVGASVVYGVALAAEPLFPTLEQGTAPHHEAAGEHPSEQQHEHDSEHHQGH